MNNSVAVYCHTDCLIKHLRKKAILQTLIGLHQVKHAVQQSDVSESEKLRKFEFLDTSIYSLKEKYLEIIMAEAARRATSPQD